MEDSKDKPLVSVVIPMFNAFPYIKEMLECMENQTYTNWELLIVDDGSTDESVATVESYAAKDDRIKLLRRPEDRKKGGNTCRNIGMENAKGEYIIWFDADDLIAPYCLEQRVNYIISYPEIDFAIFPAIPFHSTPYDTNDIVGFKKCKDPIKSFLKNFVPYQVVTNIYKCDSLNKHNIRWDEYLQARQDPDFNISCINANLEGKFSYGRPDYFWRLSGNPNSITKQIYSKTKIEANLYYLNKRIKEFNAIHKYRNSIKFLIWYIYRTFLFQKGTDAIERLLSIPYFKKHKLLKNKYRLANWINNTLGFNSKFPAIGTLILLSPISEIRNILEVRYLQPRRKRLIFREMQNKYNFIK